MAKKDRDDRIDIKRTENAGPSASQNISCNDQKKEAKTEVKNAHAVGIGAIGRHDEKLDEDNPGFNSY
ncbi:MAG: hypothetical protein ACTHOF_11105 [Flavisolibacter sp.]